MRRLVLELPVQQFTRGIGNGVFANVRSLEIVRRLTQGPRSFSAICRIEFKSAGLSLKDLELPLTMRITKLYREKDGTYIVLVVGKPGWLRNTIGTSEVVPTAIEVRDGKMRLDVLGRADQIRKFLGRMSESGLDYKVLSLTEARFSGESPLSKLTAKQRSILLSAFNLGYYQIPRRTDSEKLAIILNLDRSTVAEHLRKAEQRLVTEIISQSRELDEAN